MRARRCRVERRAWIGLPDLTASHADHGIPVPAAREDADERLEVRFWTSAGFSFQRIEAPIQLLTDGERFVDGPHEWSVPHVESYEGFFAARRGDGLGIELSQSPRAIVLNANMSWNTFSFRSSWRRSREERVLRLRFVADDRERHLALVVHALEAQRRAVSASSCEASALDDLTMPSERPASKTRSSRASRVSASRSDAVLLAHGHRSPLAEGGADARDPLFVGELDHEVFFMSW